jgi:hypothetical protein
LTGNVFDRSVKALGSIENISVETIENPEINLPEKRLDFVYGLRREDREYILKFVQVSNASHLLLQAQRCSSTLSSLDSFFGV